MPKINISTMKENNIRMIINVLRKKGAASRAELAKELHLTSPAVTIIVTDLIKKEILLEKSTEHVSLGRRPILLELNPDAAHVIGVVLSMENIIVSVGNFKAELLYKESVAIDPLLGKDKILQLMMEEIEKAMTQRNLSAEQVLSIGVAAPGPVDTEKGIIVCPPNFPDWKDVPVTDMITDKFGIPCVLDKETNAAALAEYYQLECEADPMFYLLLLPDSFGGCVLNDGKVMHGFRDESGDIGHMVIDMNGPRCVCGQYGCLEAVASGSALLKRFQDMMGTFESRQMSTYGLEKSDVTLENMFQPDMQENPLVAYVTDYAARAVATALGNVISVLSPSVIMIGSVYPGMDLSFIHKIEEMVQQRTYPFKEAGVKILPSGLGEECTAIGALVLALETFQTTLCC